MRRKQIKPDGSPMRITSAIAFSLSLVSAALWYHSPSRNYDAGRELVLAGRGAGIIGQAASHRGALHLLLMRDDSGLSPSLSTSRLTHLGNAGYHRGHGLELLGITFVVLPFEIRGTDAPLNPHVALALPYWLIILAAVSSWLRYSRWPSPSRRSDPMTIRPSYVITDSGRIMLRVPEHDGQTRHRYQIVDGENVWDDGEGLGEGFEAIADEDPRIAAADRERLGEMLEAERHG